MGQGTVKSARKDYNIFISRQTPQVHLKTVGHEI